MPARIVREMRVQLLHSELSKAAQRGYEEAQAREGSQQSVMRNEYIYTPFDWKVNNYF